MTYWKIQLEIQRIDNGFTLKATMPRDKIFMHTGTQEELMQVITNNLPKKIDEIEAAENPNE